MCVVGALWIITAAWFIWAGLVLAQLPGLKIKEPDSWWWFTGLPKWGRMGFAVLALAIGLAMAYPIIWGMLQPGAF